MSSAPSQAPFIPARDDLAQFSEYRRGQRFLEQLRPLGIDVSGKRVADLGTGFGSTAIECARAGAAEVVALDANPERLDHARGHADELGVTVNTHRINLLEGPPPGVEADVAFLVGVVEYAGLWDETRDARDLQRRIFETAHGLLAPDGQLVFGSKNRLWPWFLVGDPHTGQALVNFLPRNLANAWSRRSTGRPYRHHIHSPRRWTSLLRSAGFRDVTVYTPYFSYQLPILITNRPRLSLVKTIRNLKLPLEESTAARGSRWLPKAILMGVAGAFRVPVSHSVLVVARK